jgi:hypothetical protein
MLQLQTRSEDARYLSAEDPIAESYLQICGI